MAKTTQLLDTLKRQLRTNHITYRQVAAELELSEASVKRMFATEQFTLQRLEAICNLVGWDWADLVEAARDSQKQVDLLTKEQEKEVANDLELLLVAVSVINGYTFQDLTEQYELTEAQCIRRLAQLDRLGLIELQAGNRIKLKISTNFRWHPNGPIQKFFLDKVVQQFFDTRFASSEEKLVVANALLSDNSNQAIQLAMDGLASELSDAMRKDADLPMDARKGNTLVLALRRWRFQPFDKLTRKPSISRS